MTTGEKIEKGLYCLLLIICSVELASMRFSTKLGRSIPT